MNKMTTRGVQLAVLTVLCGCTVGPPYHRPAAVQTPGAYKELTAAQFKDTDGWKVAVPQDTAIRDKWWELFGDPQLNALEEQVKVSTKTFARPTPPSCRPAHWYGRPSPSTGRRSPLVST